MTFSLLNSFSLPSLIMRSKLESHIPQDMPAVNEVSLYEYSAMMAESILDVAKVRRGGGGGGGGKWSYAGAFYFI